METDRTSPKTTRKNNVEAIFDKNESFDTGTMF